MKTLNIVGGILCGVLLCLGALRGERLPLPHVPLPHVVHEEPLIGGDGLHVLIVEEVDDRRSLPREQLDAMTSATLRGWMTDHQADFHLWDTDHSTQHEKPEWQAALKIPRQSLPWLIVSEKGKQNFSGPLPADLAGLMDVLKTYE